MTNLKQLEWDSNFFERDVYSLSTDYELSVDILKELKEDSLTYIVSSIEQPSFERYLFDQKVTFSRSISQSCILDTRSHLTSIFSEDDIKKLHDLSIRASHLSRFRKDPKIDNDRVDEMYRIWVDSALKADNKYIITARQDSQIVGFIIASSNESAHSIEVIAVDESYSGRGIGKDLINSFYNEVLLRCGSTIKVITQLDNMSACALYQKMGFVKESLVYIFHLHT